MRRRRAVWLILAGIVAALATSVSFAATNATATISVSEVSTAAVSVVVADASDPDHTGEYGSLANIPVVAEGATGSVQAGDLYVVDATSYTGDIWVTLYLNNPDTLANDYSYMNLTATVYVYGSGWTVATDVNGDPASQVLSLTNGYVSFLLLGGHKYSVSLDNGAFYTLSANGTGPSFYVDVEPR